MLHTTVTLSSSSAKRVLFPTAVNDQTFRGPSSDTDVASEGDISSLSGASLPFLFMEESSSYSVTPLRAVEDLDAS